MTLLRLIVQNFACLLFPNFIKVKILNFLGHKINRNAYVGIVFLSSKSKLIMSADSVLSHFNYIACNEFTLSNQARIGKFNRFSGFFSVNLDKCSTIGNFNSLVNGGRGCVIESTAFKLGFSSNITSYHYFDLTDNIKVEKQVVIGGRSSQFWTHGFQHFKNGTVRNRVDGGISISDGCYIASSVVVNPGVSIGKNISIGSGTIVSKSLYESGLYVGQALRFIPVKEEDFYNKYVLRDRENPHLGFVRGSLK